MAVTASIDDWPILSAVDADVVPLTDPDSVRHNISTIFNLSVFPEGLALQWQKLEGHLLAR